MTTPINKTIAIIGLGYVGLPLAVEFGKHRPVLGFDINKQRIDELKSGQDHTLECSPAQLKEAAQLRYSNQLDDLRSCQIFIVTVPTPVDQANRPDMTPLVKASETVGKVLKAGDSQLKVLRVLLDRAKMVFADAATAHYGDTDFAVSDGGVVRQVHGLGNQKR